MIHIFGRPPSYREQRFLYAGSRVLRPTPDGLFDLSDYPALRQRLAKECNWTLSRREVSVNAERLELLKHLGAEQAEQAAARNANGQ